MIDHLQQQRQSEEWQQTLIAADAPLEMLQTLFGVGAREYTRLRRVLTVEPSVGRPLEPDEATSHRLWTAWKSQAGSEDAEVLSPETYLELHHETNIPMRAVWNLTQRWAQFGDLTGEDDDE